MFATRDQENLVHARQAAAAGKPLNQGIRSLQPKTPGNVKTPFGGQKNDENRQFPLQDKTLRKDGPSKQDYAGFVTPAAGKTRAPLGFKTTNAKAQPLKTPGPGQPIRNDKTTRKPSTARRSARKITVANTEQALPSISHAELEDEEPDYGYAPPPIVELPDPPMDFDIGQHVPHIQPEDILKVYGQLYLGSPKDSDGVSIRQKREAEEAKKYREEQDRELLRAVQYKRPKRSDPDAEVDAMITAGPKSNVKAQVKESRVPTIKAKSAAMALSSSTARLPAVITKQTASSMQKLVKNGSSIPQNSRPPPTSVSRNTIGFPKAKQAPSIVPPASRTQKSAQTESSLTSPPDQKSIHPVDFVKLYGEPPVESDMWIRLKQHQLIQQDSDDLFDIDTGEDDLANELSSLELFSPGFECDEDVFQLPVPDD